MSNPRVCPAPGLGLVRVQGANARTFLHAQTTQRFNDFPADATRLAAWLTPGGRVRALFDVIPDGDAFWLLLPRDLCDSLVAGLGRYVLHADVGLEVRDDPAVFSLLDASAAWLAERGLTLGERGIARLDDALLVRMTPERIDVVVAAKALPAALAGLDSADADAAAATAIVAGRPEVSAAVSEHFLPQMLNLDKLGAVAFNKGCYPGQEIVARTENLGTVKRRLQRFAVDAGARPVPGEVVLDAAGKAQGEIDRVAQVGAGFELLAVVRVIPALESAALADGRRLNPRHPALSGEETEAPPTDGD